MVWSREQIKGEDFVEMGVSKRFFEMAIDKKLAAGCRRLGRPKADSGQDKIPSSSLCHVRE
jgi:hypothetical protein